MTIDQYTLCSVFVHNEWVPFFEGGPTGRCETADEYGGGEVADSATLSGRDAAPPPGGLAEVCVPLPARHSVPWDLAET